MKIKLKANYNLLLGKMLIIPNMIIVVRFVFQENSNFIHINFCMDLWKSYKNVTV